MKKVTCLLAALLLTCGLSWAQSTLNIEAYASANGWSNGTQYLTATVDDVTKHLSLGESILYLGGLAAICAVDYVIFSITTLYYIGYPLLIAYYVFALRRLSL